MSSAAPRILDRATLDQEYDNVKKLPADVLQRLFARLDHASSIARKKHDVVLDVAYGPTPLERLDIFRAPKVAADVQVFFHGGYWHALDKESFSYIADGLVPHDITTVVVNYPLLPAVGLADQVAACRRALRWVYNHISDYGGNPRRVSVFGHSAGAHLAGMLLTHVDAVSSATATEAAMETEAEAEAATETEAKAESKPEAESEPDTSFPAYACLISGIYDLAPIRQCFVNDTLNLSEEDVIKNSPVRLRQRSNCPVSVVVGGDEGDEYLRQSRDLAHAWSQSNRTLQFSVLDNENHFSLREQLGDPDSRIVKLVSAW